MSPSNRHSVFLTGGTGYIGSRLIPILLARGHTVRALARESSKTKLPAGCDAVIGDLLKAEGFENQIPPCDTFVQLVGVARPSPAKAAEFKAIDLASGLASVTAASKSGIRHFIYVSVAHPAPAMKAYIEVRTEVERTLLASGLNATILRPWYVLGPGHRWPYFLIPLYWICERLPGTREGARRLGLITITQMLAALAHAVDDPVQGTRVLDVPSIRDAGRNCLIRQ